MITYLKMKVIPFVSGFDWLLGAGNTFIEEHFSSMKKSLVQLKWWRHDLESSENNRTSLYVFSKVSHRSRPVETFCCFSSVFAFQTQLY